MKKCLFITTQFPYPLDNGGKIGAYNGLSVVSSCYDVTVLSFSEEMKYVTEGIAFFKTKFPNIKFELPIEHDIHIRKKPIKLIKVMLKDYLLSKPYVTEKFHNDSMFKEIDKQFENENYFDLVFIDYLNMGIYLEYIKKIYSGKYNQIVLKDHNIEYEIVKQEANKSTGIKKTILDREWKVTKKYEENCIKNVDKVFSVCSENTNFLKKNNLMSYTMLPTFEMLPTRKQIDEHNILYMGNLSWGANLEGLKWFIREVMPKIVEKVSDAKLTVVGSGPHKEMFSDYDYVEYRGYIKDISHIYDNHSVFIVPLFEGSGIRIKILEAFNNEIAVVSTNLGCETIGAVNEKEIMIADSSIDFARSVIELLKNQNKRFDLVKSAKNFLNKNYSLKSRQEEFTQIIENR